MKLKLETVWLLALVASHLLQTISAAATDVSSRTVHLGYANYQGVVNGSTGNV